MGEDRANEGHEKNKRLHARAEDNPADLQHGPLIYQAAINLDKATTTGLATDLVMKKVKPASC